MSHHSVVLKQEHAHEEAIWACTWTLSERTDPKGDYIVTGSLDNTVKVWNWTNQGLTLQNTLEGHHLGVISAESLAFGDIAVTSSIDCRIRSWDLPTGSELANIDAGPVDSWTLALSPDATKVATGANSGLIHVYSLENGTKLSSLETGGRFMLSVVYSPNGKLLAGASSEGMVYIFDVATGTLLHTLEGHAMPIRTLQFAADSKILFSGSDDKYIKMHDVFSGGTSALICSVPAHTAWVTDIAISPDGKQFASCSCDQTVRIWELSSKPTQLHKFTEHTDQTWAVRYNHSGTRLASVGEDRSLIIYSTPI